MAAFPFEQPALLPDYFLPEEFVPNFNQFYSSFENYPSQIPVANANASASARESSSVEQPSADNETPLSETQRNDNSSMANKPESSEQLTQNGGLVDKKRKSSNGSSLNSASSKDVKHVKCKKLKGDKETMINKKNDNKGQSKATDEPPKGYIHVRARRGQATDSHSLAERVRREKISKKMGTLQALVPGCDKVTGKALMLDEIINYVQSLQNQVEFLSMKLASLDPVVYQFGLMDLDPMICGADVQGMNNNMAMPNPLLMQSANSNASGNNSPAQSFPTANNSCLTSPATSSAPSPIFLNPQVDDSTNFLPHDLKPNFLHFQDVGSSYWGVNEQERQRIINQFGLSGNNLFSLQ